jgi:hypothetical protein
MRSAAMADKWEIKAVGAKEISVKLPDQLELGTDTGEISPVELASFILEAVKLQEMQARGCLCRKMCIVVW